MSYGYSTLKVKVKKVFLLQAAKNGVFIEGHICSVDDLRNQFEFLVGMWGKVDLKE